MNVAELALLGAICAAIVGTILGERFAAWRARRAHDLRDDRADDQGADELDDLAQPGQSSRGRP